MKPDDFQPNAPGHVIRQPTGYWAFIPNPLPPQIEWSAELIATLSSADRALGELAGLAHAMPNPALLIQHDHLLAVSQKGAWTAWLLYFLRGIFSITRGRQSANKILL